MPLVKQVLENSLKNLVSNPDNFPDSYEQAAANFADAINDYGKLVVPSTTTSELAKQAFVSAFIASKPKQSLDILVDAITAYCVSLATGMAPAFVGVPPTTTPILQAALQLAGQIALNGGTADDWASAAATAIDTYFRTGTATNSSTGVTITWS